MKCVWSLLFLLSLANLAKAQTPAPVDPVAPAPSPAAEAPLLTTASTPLSESIFLDVKDLGTNLSSSSNWRSVWGSYSKNVTRARALEINLRNPAKIPGEYVVEWYFFATPVRGGRRFLFDRETKNVSLPPGGSEKATVVSDELQTRSVRYSYDYYYYGHSHKSGTKPEGWLVTVSANKKVIRMKSSGAALDTLYKNTAEFQTLITPVEGKSNNRD